MEDFIPKKRKRSSSSSDNPFAGVFTRSKSQIYLHCHRSGRARSDSFRRSKYHAELWSKPVAAGVSSEKCRPKSLTEEISDSTQRDDDWSGILVKDLRIRRVFSTGPIADYSEEEKESEKRKGADEDGLSSEGTDKKCLEGRKVEERKSDVEFSGQEQNSINNPQVAERNTRNCVDCEISGEESVQATPPDAEFLQKLSNASDGLQDNTEKKDSSNSVLSSRSRVKVFKVPYSFSYRRLLPYLTRMVQDNSCAATNSNCSNVDNQPMVTDEFKVNGNSMDILGGESGLHDVQSLADELSVQHVADSATPQKGSSTIASSPTPLDGELCSKHFDDSLNDNIEIGPPSGDKNLESSSADCSPRLHNPRINGDLNESKSLDGEESVRKHQLCEDDGIRPGSCRTMQTESVGMEAFDLGCSDKTVDANHVSSFVSSEEEKRTKEEGDDNVVAGKIDDLNEESVRMTPPAVLCNTVAYQNAGKQIEFVSQSAGQVLGRSVNGIVPQNNSCSNDKRMNSSSKRKMGISPCSQLKLFKIRGSFSYRRLLPFLTDIAKDNSGDSGNGHCQKVEKIAQENLLSPSSISAEDTQAQKLNNKSIHLEHNNGNCSNVENQPMLTDEFKVDGECRLSDVQNFVDELSAQHIADSASLIPPQKDSSTVVSSPTSLDGKLCSKHFDDSLNDNIEIGVPSRDKNLESSSPDCSPRLYNPHINGDLNESNSLDGEESAKKSRLCEDEEASRQGSCSTMQSESVGMEAFDLGCSDKTIDANHVSSFVSSEEENRTKEEGDGNDVDDKNDDSKEESIRMTLPAVDILRNTITYQNADKGIEHVSQSAGQVLGRPVNGIVPQNSSRPNDKIMTSSSKRKMGLSPCSQLKLLKTRSSFSYRRLLPFLTDFAKDISGDSGYGHCPRVEKIAEENLLSPLSMSAKETQAQKLNNKSIHLEHNNDPCTIQTAKKTSSHESGCMLSNLVASDHKNENPDSVVMKQEQEFQVMHLMSDDKTAPGIENLANETNPNTMTVCSSVVSPKSYAIVLADSVVRESSANSEEDSKTSVAKVEANAANPVEASSFGLTQNSCKLEASDPSASQIPVNSSKKGILKRNPRGCRGPCTCLNCSSFRLNAERAFEFSKNQMLDAEEVALGLIKELSHLRNMLGTAASGCNDNLAIHMNQVKEACARASEAEEVAKSRLAQMNYDLNIHCRTADGQRPRVKFSNNVEERMISYVNLTKIQTSQRPRR